jgi:hypothetical protein
VNDLRLLELGRGSIVPDNAAINGSVKTDIAGVCGMLIASAAHNVEGARTEGRHGFYKRLHDGSLGRQSRSREIGRHERTLVGE